MKTQKCLLLFALMLLFVSASRAQDVTVTFLKERTGIRIQLDPGTLPPASFRKIAKQSSTYTLYEVENPDPDKMCKFAGCINEVGGLLDPQHPPTCDDDVCRRIELHFAPGKQLDVGKNFILVAQRFNDDGTSGKLKFNSQIQAKITDPFNANNKKNGFDVIANARLQAVDSVSVQRTTYKLTEDSMNVVKFQDTLPATIDRTVKAGEVPGKPTPTRLSFRLESKLKEGQQYQLAIPTGIKDDTGQNLAAEGTLKIPGTPDPPDDPGFSIKLSSSSSTKKKSVFDLTSSFTKKLSGISGWYPEPKIDVDVGLRSTTSNNAITAAFPLTRELLVQTTHLRPGTETNIPRYAAWAQTSWRKRSSLKFYVGPKVELDSELKRVNVLGSTRFELKLFRWLGTIAYKRSLISAQPTLTQGLNIGGIGKEKGALVDGIDTGFKLVPYFELNFGGHVNDQTVKKDTSSVLVPRHGIFRSYLGGAGTLEWRTGALPTTLKFDASIIYLAVREQIGYTNDDGAFLRSLRGFHPHFKTSLDFAFDPGKHYSLDITYENGRSAPNFSYLNKVTTGIKLTY